MNNLNKENKYLFKKIFSFKNIKRELLVVFCFLNSIAYLQESDTLFPQKYFYSSGRISSEGRLESGLPAGIWRNYYESGILKSEGEKIAGKSSGTWIFYSPEGIIEKRISYRENLKNGSYQQFDSTGKIALENFYRNDTLQGISRSYKNGRLKSECKYDKGKKNGEEHIFDETDGRVIESIYYVNDQPESKISLNRLNVKNQKTGLWRTYYPDGKIKTECLFANDSIIGACKEWSEKGILKLDRGSSDFKEVVEVSQTFHPNGQLAFFESHFGKIKHGASSYFDTSGVLLGSKLYHMDTLLADGFILSSGIYDSTWIYFYPNQQKSAEGKYKNGLKTGIWTYYNAQGKIIQQGTFRRGVVDGEWRWYYGNGQLRLQESYVMGKREGLSVEYDSLGIKLMEGTYIDDLRDGEWFYHKNEFVEKGTFAMGLKTGPWKYFCKDESNAVSGKVNLCFKGTFKNDVPVGKHYYYHSNGKLKMYGKFRNGKQNSKWEEFDDAGNLVHTYYYKNGVLIYIDGDRPIKNSEQ